ncbi:hypothetical protein ACFO3D_04760 [Virgibacillus kekensis]|uniref:Degradation enzyme regulation protein DegQ n=1 Tax=Virgibacillus kekensis TaxID=202261 RepID=A0ABV9DFP6_9BACI
MSDSKYEILQTRIQQHEETITQLVEIIAVINRRLSDLDRKEREQSHTYSLT